MRALTSIAIGVVLALVGCAGPLPSSPHRVPVTLPSPATLTAELLLPRGPGPFAALTLLHGCGGVGANVVGWAKWLQAEGYAAFVLDSFGGRGISGSAARAPCSPPVRGRATCSRLA